MGKKIFISKRLVLFIGICLSALVLEDSYADTGFDAAYAQNVDGMQKCGKEFVQTIEKAKALAAGSDQVASQCAESAQANVARNNDQAASFWIGSQQYSCASDAKHTGANAYSQIALAAKSCQGCAPAANDNAAKKACQQAASAIAKAASVAASGQGMNAMQMMQMGQMGLQMMGSLASLMGSGSKNGGGGGSSAVTSSGPTAQSLGDSAVSAPVTPSTAASSPTSTGASSTPGPTGPLAATIDAGKSNDPAAPSPDSSVTAPNGAGAGGAGSAPGAMGSAFASTGSGTAVAIDTSVNPLAAVNAFNQDDGGSGGGAMLGLKGSSDFQSLDPNAKDGMPGALASGSGTADADAGRGLASGEGQALAQNDVHDQATSLFDLVSVKMREMKKRGSL